MQPIDLDKSRQELTRLRERTGFLPKIRWTQPLGRQMRRYFYPRPGNIVLGEASVGIPDAITETISQPANCAILIVNGENDRIYLERRNLYREFLASQHILVIAEFRSRPRGQVKETTVEPLKSELRAFQPGEFLGGQLVGLQFGEPNEDPVIEVIAKILLYNLLPTLGKKKRGNR